MLKSSSSFVKRAIIFYLPLGSDSCLSAQNAFRRDHAVLGPTIFSNPSTCRTGIRLYPEQNDNCCFELPSLFFFACWLTFWIAKTGVRGQTRRQALLHPWLGRVRSGLGLAKIFGVSIFKLHSRDWPKIRVYTKFRGPRLTFYHVARGSN